MIEEDQELVKLTEQFMTSRVYAPRVQLSPDFKRALAKEILSLMGDNISPKRIVSAIHYKSQEQIEGMKTNLRKIKKQNVSQPETKGTENHE